MISTLGVSIAQIAFGIHYIHKPVNCERSKFLTILILAGGFSSILSTVYLLCCCRGSGCGSKSSDPESSERLIN